MTLGLTTHRPGELPAEVTRFVGRQRELAELSGLLRSARLVTVIGPGGVGKTRIAQRVAAQLASEFGDGACLVELSGLRDPELLPDTVANCLGLPGSEGPPQLDLVLDHLRDRSKLLILDTCEHLIDACAMLAEILLRTTGTTVLATSRQPLAVPGEHTCSIPPLPVPAPGRAHRRRRATRWSCSPGAPRQPCPASPSPTPTGPTWSGSAGAWTGCRWPSSWPRSGSARCRWCS